MSKVQLRRGQSNQENKLIVLLVTLSAEKKYPLSIYYRHDSYKQKTIPVSGRSWSIKCNRLRNTKGISEYMICIIF